VLRHVGTDSFRRAGASVLGLLLLGTNCSLVEIS